MTIDQPRRDPPPRAIDPVSGIGIRRKVGTLTREDDAAIASRDHASLDYTKIG
jgi:hypothetical protein